MPSARRPQRSWRTVDWWTVTETWAATVLKFALVAIAISLGYLLYGIFSGALNGGPTGVVEPRIVDAISTFGQILAVSSLLAAAALIIVTLEDLAFTVLVGIYGLALMLGTPFLITSNLRSPQSPAAQELNYWGQMAGKLVLLLVAIRIGYEIVTYVRQGPSRRKASAAAEGRPEAAGRKQAANPILMQRCWEMPFCHERIREICPAYAKRRSCWKFGRGCNCDPRLIESLIRVGGITGRGTPRDSHRVRTEGAYIRSDLEADLSRDTGERTITCDKCAIYTERQRQKFRLVNPLAILATVVAMAALYVPLQALYSSFIDVLANFAAAYSYGESIRPEQWFSQLDTPGVQVFFFVILFLLALAYVLKFVEWAVLVKKW